MKEFFRRILEGGENIEENVIKVLIIKQYEHPEVYMLKNTLETMREGLCQVSFANIKFSRLVAGSQPAMISDSRSSSALKR